MESKLFRLKRIRAQIWRFLPVAFLVLSLALIVLTKTGNRVVLFSKQEAVSFFAPVISVLSKPIHWGKDMADALEDWASVYRENERLKSENEQLVKWHALALELQAEQKELKEYLNYVSPPETPTMMAQIVMDEGSAFSRSFIVSVGQNQGVKKGMLAFSSRGLFARVVEVMPNYARVMALTDYLSRVPVWVGKNKLSALLVGDNTCRPYLQFLEDGVSVHEGDVVMTSGYVGVYPPGLMIGKVDEVHEEDVRVHPFEDGEKLFFVRLLDYSVPKPLLQEETK